MAGTQVEFAIIKKNGNSIVHLLREKEVVDSRKKAW
jgi:hypothetical protein